MKTGLAFLLLVAMSGFAATTINPTNKFSYGANIGWMDWRGDTNSGAVIGEYVCSGYIYSADCGWISLGSGSPANTNQYQNLSAGDFGVNHDGIGNLRGYAYGANIGWINFENTGAAKVDLSTGQLSGQVYSANCGWITLNQSFAIVQTDIIRPGTDSDGDGMADAWEMQHALNLTTFNASSDSDGDGASDLQEYRADTDPLDGNSKLKILSPFVAFGGGNQNDDFVTWTSRPTRFYMLAYRTNLTSDPWHTLGALFPPDGATTTRDIAFGASSTQRYFRVQAVKPLSP
jgi:hypothetical protein